MELQESRKKHVLDKINQYLDDMGEDPFEYQAKAAPIPAVFMSWAYGKGYITKDRFDAFLVEISGGELEFFQLFGDKDDEEAYIISDDHGYDILAEFVASSDFYLERFNTNFKLQ